MWGATINNVTIRMLLNMRSGLEEYNGFDIAFGPFLAYFSASCHPTRAVRCTLLNAHAGWMLVGACDPIIKLCDQCPGLVGAAKGTTMGRSAGKPSTSRTGT